MDKRGDAVYVRLPSTMKRLVETHARKHLRSFNETLILLIAKGLHDEQFTLAPYTAEDRDVETS